MPDRVKKQAPEWLHDMNNILAAVRGYAEFLVEDLPEGSVHQNFARKILEAGQQGQVVADKIFPPANDIRAHQGKRVLLVEDQESVREMMIHMLTRMGFEVVSAADGYEALSILKEQQYKNAKSFAAIIADMDMPKLCGVALAERVEIEYPEMAFILLSGAQEDVLASVRASRPFIRTVLRKPVSRIQMEREIDFIFNNTYIK